MILCVETDINKNFIFSSLFPLHSYSKVNSYSIGISGYLFLVCSEIEIYFDSKFTQLILFA